MNLFCSQQRAFNLYKMHILHRRNTGIADRMGYGFSHCIHLAQAPQLLRQEIPRSRNTNRE
ncbi:hypothetical protein D3C72_2572050 [compost metagenome]